MGTKVIANITDQQDDVAEVGVTTYIDGALCVTLDFDSNMDSGVSIMSYDAKGARELAAALILAAEELEK